MLFGDARITTQQFADQFVREVLTRMRGSAAPCAIGDRKSWSAAIFNVLKRMAQERGYDQHYEWLADHIWWSTAGQHFGLAVESELDRNPQKVEDDFCKLVALKCPLKVLVYSAKEPEEMKIRAETFLLKCGQHVKDERYLLIAFTGHHAQCYQLTIPRDGRCSNLKFEPLNIQQSRGAS